MDGFLLFSEIIGGMLIIGGLLSFILGLAFFGVVIEYDCWWDKDTNICLFYLFGGITSIIVGCFVLRMLCNCGSAL